MARAFVSVTLPGDVLRAVAAATQHVPRRVRMTKPHQWHLTLSFLGDHADVDAVVDAFAGFAEPGGVVQLGGAGAFPDARAARVLWIGVAEGSEVLARLARGVAERLGPLGYEVETKPFRPHVTIGRAARPTDLRAAVAQLDGLSFGPPWRVDALVVFESQLRPDGARHIERATVPLPG